MAKLYIVKLNREDFDGKKADLRNREVLMEVLKGHFSREGIEEPTFEVIRDDLGKPHIQGLDCPSEISITHSGEYWGILITKEPCGLDIQKIGEREIEHYIKIAEGFFKDEEAKYIRETGIDGFFELWTRREALGKMIGKGFFSEMPLLTEEPENDYGFFAVDLPGYKCNLCMKKDENLETVFLEEKDIIA